MRLEPDHCLQLGQTVQCVTLLERYEKCNEQLIIICNVLNHTKQTANSGVILQHCIRESVDSLCRDGADAQYMQYLSKSRITSPQIC